MPNELARAAVAKRKIKRMAGLLREAEQELAALLGDADVFGSCRVHDAASSAKAGELVELGVARYGEVELVVIARPKRAPTKGADAPKESTNGRHAAGEAGAAGAPAGAGAGGSA